MDEVVITGLGIVCPIGVGSGAVGSALAAGRSGVRAVPELVEAGFPIPIAGDVADFEPKQYVKPRKALKVMSRESQLGFAAADLAYDQAQLGSSGVDPDRFGVTCGSNMFVPEIPELAAACHASDDGTGRFDFQKWGTEGLDEIIPLWLLKYLPNMTPCHIGIARDARGPSNSILAGETSGVLALIEAADVVARGHADVMIAGGVSSTICLMDMVWRNCARLSRRVDEPERASRPFDRDRDGYVGAEGAALFVVEKRSHAEARGVPPIARLLGSSRTNEAAADDYQPTGSAIRRSIEMALRSADISAADVGHVSAHGMSTPLDDRIEAQAIAELLGETPVTATKSFIGNIGAAGGAVELAISLIGLLHSAVPPTLNYESPDPDCPVNVVTETTPMANRLVLKLSHRTMGSAAAVVLDVA